MRKLKICINEDNGHFYSLRTQEQMTDKCVRDLVVNYEKMGVNAVFFCTNVRRALFDSKVWEPVYADYDPAAGMDQPALREMDEDAKVLKLDNQGLQLLHNLWLLKQRGIDHHAVWLDECRNRNIEGWLSVRMNDIHYSSKPEYFWNCTFWKNHPEFRRIPYKNESDWDHAFDYAHPEVREHHFALIKELFERYDFYGLELDWIRSILHFAPGGEEEGCRILTEFVRDVSELATEWSEKRGHKIKLSVRVPECPQTCVRLGMDVPTWLREKLVDQIVLSQWLSAVSFDSPINIWRAMVGGSDIDILLNISNSHLPYSAVWRKGRIQPDIEMLRGVANSATRKGADGLYFFNYCYKSTKEPEFLKDVLADTKSPEALITKSRRYLISPIEISAPGEEEHAVLPVSFDDEYGAAKYSRAITLSPDLGYIGRFNSAYAIIGFDKDLPAPLDSSKLEVRVNGVLCDFSDGSIPAVITGKAGAVFMFIIPVGALHDGRNALEIIPCDENIKGTVVWGEIYLG